VDLTGVLPQPLAVCAAGALCARGRGWRGLGTALRDGGAWVSGPAAGAPAQAAVSDVVLEASEDAAVAKQRKQMSRGARLAAAALRDALSDAGWSAERQQVGAFLGVGSSGGAVSELRAVLVGSVEGGEFSLRRLGEAGLGAANPLFTFQLMSNFVLCHGAIQAGLGGPTAAFYSRGGGTVLALQEAAWSLLDGECTEALAGGADTALYPVTLAELLRGGWLGAGLLPGEGAAVLALARQAAAPLALFTRCALLPASDPCLGLDGRVVDAVPATTLLAVDQALAATRQAPPEAVVLLACSAGLRAAMQERLAAALPGACVLDVVSALGDPLAGGPALGWAAALDLIAAGAQRVLVLSVGLDGDLGVVELQRGPG
jgi:hypothetical protein